MKLTVKNLRAEQTLWTSNSWVHGFIDNVVETLEDLLSKQVQLVELGKSRAEHLEELLKEKRSFSETMGRMAKQIQEQLVELQVLRPPAPKFRVGQVVIQTYLNGTENAFTIRHAKLSGDNKHWWYANARLERDINWCPEDRFRALKSEEIG